jgi:hypothetical protein
MKILKFLVSVVFVGVFLEGCTYAMKVNNLDEYYSSSGYLSKKISIGIVNNGQGQISDKHIDEIVFQLRAMNQFTEVQYPMSSKSKKPDFVVEIGPRIKYDGSGLNFLINWPGVYIFMPGWNGYKYTADIKTEIKYVAEKGQPVEKRYETLFRANQSEFDRTWTVPMDWFLTFGVSSLIGGFFVTSFDEDVQPEFFRYYSQPYAKFIANKIVVDLSTL